MSFIVTVLTVYAQVIFIFSVTSEMPDITVHCAVLWVMELMFSLMFLSVVDIRLTVH